MKPNLILRMAHPDFGTVRYTDTSDCRWYAGIDVINAMVPNLHGNQPSNAISTCITKKGMPFKQLCASGHSARTQFIEEDGVSVLAVYADTRWPDMRVRIETCKEWILGEHESGAVQGTIEAIVSEEHTAFESECESVIVDEPMVFTSPEFKNVRVVEIDGEPWWVLADVCRELEIVNASAVAKRLNDDEKRTASFNPNSDLGLSHNGACIVNESGLYKVVLRSDKPKAEPFMHWVSHDVVPSIRKHGGYMTAKMVEEILSDPDTLIRLATQLKEERNKRAAAEEALAKSNEQCVALEKQRESLACENEIQRQRIAEFKPVRDYVDTILSSTDCLRVTQIAADYDMSAIKLNQILASAGVQHKVSGQWILYREYMEQGYTKAITTHYEKRDGTIGSSELTVWTQKGRLFIHSILTDLGYMAHLDKTLTAEVIER